jgi:hypothetical protein
MRGDEALHDADLVAVVFHREGAEAEEVIEAHVGAVEACAVKPNA